MATCDLSTQSVRDVFEVEVNRLGGELREVVDDGRRLIARSVFPTRAHVKPGDEVQGGVAIRGSECAICVHPYTLRKVCRNGAVMIRSAESWRIDALEVRSPEHVKAELREAIEACASGRALDASVLEMHTASMDLALNALAWIARSPLAPRWLGEILSRLAGEPDVSRFSMMNAVTSLARDAADPDQKWELEELGGSIAAMGALRDPELDPARLPLRAARVGGLAVGV